ncbi:FG-GAP repeat protein [Streptomyces amakusaensis]|uniref:FG-GAP-like repeat-containing protein n=1 Tax=Streptomyces amakusaensis TaxID=67271 RepID=A0ABW0AP72_9ACTN
MNTRSATRGLGLLTAIAAIGTLTAPVAFGAPTPVPAGTSKKLPAQPKDDFNGDGYADLAVGSPNGRIERKNGAGYVSVVYGSKSGLNLSSKQLLHQGVEGVPGTTKVDDRFGSSLASADLDRDGYADLVVGVAGEDPTPEFPFYGVMTVVWGGPKGLGRGTAPGKVIKGAGRHLVTGDFNGDGNPDLVTGEYGSGLRMLHGPFDTAGGPARESSTPPTGDDDDRILDGIRAGDVNGDGITDIVGLHGWRDDSYWRPELVFWEGTPTGPIAYRHIKDQKRRLVLGDTLDVGDVNKDGYADIAVGLLYGGETSAEVPSGGQVTYIKGSAKGPLGSRNKVFHLDSPRVPGSSKTSGGFGSAVSVGDLDGDKYEDITVGVAGMNVDGRRAAGSVITLRGTASGPTSKVSKEFHQNTKGVPGSAEAGDLFGNHLKTLDANGDGREELAVSAPGENENAGAMWVFKTDKNGVTPNGSFVYGPETLGLDPDPVRFGEVLTY